MNWTMFFLLITGAALIALAVSRLKDAKSFSFKNKRIENRQKVFKFVCLLGVLALAVSVLLYIG